MKGTPRDVLGSGKSAWHSSAMNVRFCAKREMRYLMALRCVSLSISSGMYVYDPSSMFFGVSVPTNQG